VLQVSDASEQTMQIRALSHGSGSRLEPRGPPALAQSKNPHFKVPMGVYLRRLWTQLLSVSAWPRPVPALGAEGTYSS